MIKVKNLDKNPVWQEVWEDYYDRAEEIKTDYDTVIAYNLYRLCFSIEQAVNYILEYNPSTYGLENDYRN